MTWSNIARQRAGPTIWPAGNFLVLGGEEKAGDVLDIVADQILTLVRE